MSEFWDTIGSPNREDPDQMIEAAEEGLDDPAKLYPEGWALVVAVASIEDPAAARVLVRHSPEGQSPFMTGGMLLDSAHGVLNW